MEEQLIVIKTEYGDLYLQAKVPYDPEEEELVANEGEIPVKHISQNLDKALASVKVLFAGVNKLRQELGPDEFSLEVGAKMDVKTKMFVLSAGSEVSFKIQLKWKAVE